jgi:carboxylesterase type B
VLVISFNYRTNIFGQPGAPQLSGSTTNLNTMTETQNFGLLDVNAAVEWVHDNIATFGSDPECIVLCGQSTGAAAVDAYSYMNPDNKFVKGMFERCRDIWVFADVGIYI